MKRLLILALLVAGCSAREGVIVDTFNQNGKECLMVTGANAGSYAEGLYCKIDP